MLAVAATSYFYWSNMCGGHSCSESLLEGFLFPLIWGPLALSFSFGTVAFFSEKTIKFWLIGVLSWFLPLSILIVANIDIRSESWFLNITRGHVAWLLGILLYIITTIFIVGFYVVSYWKGKIQKAELKKLLLLVPTSGIVYALTQIFNF